MGISLELHRCRIGAHNSGAIKLCGGSPVSFVTSATAAASALGLGLFTAFVPLLLECRSPDLWLDQQFVDVLFKALCFIGFFGFHYYGCVPFLCGVFCIDNIQEVLLCALTVHETTKAALCCAFFLAFYIITRVPFIVTFYLAVAQPSLISDPTVEASLNAFLCFISLTCQQNACHEQMTEVTVGLAFQVLRLLLVMGGVETNPGPEFQCKICKTKWSSAVSYCEHFKIHKSTKHVGILCPNVGCAALLSSLGSFQAHFSRFHSPKQEVPQSSSFGGGHAGVPCPCEGCMVFITSMSDYLQHINKVHFGAKNTQPFICIFKNCRSTMKNLSQFRTHVSRYHGQDDEESATFFASVQKPPSPLAAGSQSTEMMDISFEAHKAGVAVDSDSDEENLQLDPSEEDLYPDCVIKDELARFYLKLEADDILPTSIVQTVASEIKLVSELIHAKLKVALRKELKAISMEEKQIDQIINKTFLNDPIFNIHHKGMDTEQLGTDHLRMNFWRKIYKFIEPTRVSLGVGTNGKKRYAHLISVRETLTALLEDKDVADNVLKSFNIKPREEVFSDFIDGSTFKEHIKCHQHEGKKCLQLFFFQDGFDPTAFGGSGAYKPLGFYWTLGNLPPEVRSRLSLIQLAFMVLEKDLKNTVGEELNDFDRLKESLKPLINELIDLRKNGIILNGEKVHVCVMFLLGDSLGQNYIGRFVQSFSSEFSCRFCNMSRTNFLQNPHIVNPLRSSSEYDEDCKQAKKSWVEIRRVSLDAHAKAKAREAAKRQAERVAARSTAPSKRNVSNLQTAISKSAYQKLKSVHFKGVKYRPSPFNNQDLQFHVAGNQPPCLAHDLNEGIIKLVVPKILKDFIQAKNWFDLETLNKRITRFKCCGTDALDKPKPLKSLDSLSGNAVENWNLLRLLPFIIGELIVDEEDPLWNIMLLLKEICTLAFAPKISQPQIEYLRSLIEEYLTKLKDHLPDCLTPKHHYLCHYPDLIYKYGPLTHLFTLRFESKHAFFKRIMRACKNYINVTYTMARKYVCRSALDRSTDLLAGATVYGDSSPVDAANLPDEIRNTVTTDMEELKKVTIFGTEYFSGQYVLLGAHEDGTALRVGCIKKVLLKVNSNQVFFVLEETKAIDSYSGYYKLEKTSRASFVLHMAQDLPDFYPLPAYEFNGQLCLTLKHTAPFMA